MLLFKYNIVRQTHLFCRIKCLMFIPLTFPKRVDKLRNINPKRNYKNNYFQSVIRNLKSSFCTSSSVIFIFLHSKNAFFRKAFYVLKI